MGSDAVRERGRARFPAVSAEGRPGGPTRRGVSGNGRVVFRFEEGEAVDVDLADYR